MRGRVPRRGVRRGSRRGSRRSRALAAACLAAALAAAAAADDEELPANHASRCPYCHGDPALMEASGTVSHGGFAFGTRDTAGTEALLPEVELLWIETEHFEIGLGLEGYGVPSDEREGIRAELERLEEALPDVRPRTRELDPWLRLHLYAQRVDDLWTEVQGILQVEDDDFPAADEVWRPGDGPYRGEGQHLGQPGKYELLVLPDVGAQVRWLGEEFGLRSQNTQRWNVVDRQTLCVVMTDEGRLRSDAALHGHVVFCLALNLLDGYEFYAYETPVWIREGLAHFLERRLEPKHNSFSPSESVSALSERNWDWIGPLQRLARSGDLPRLAELAHLRTTAELGMRHHFASWGLTAYLVDRHADGYACLNAELHGIVDSRGYADGGAMKDRHRHAFERCFGMKYHELDEAWQAWLREQDPEDQRQPESAFRRTRALDEGS